MDTGNSDSDGSTSVSTLIGKAAPNAVVRFAIDGQASANTATADGNGNWVYRPVGLRDGNHTIVASVAGVVGTASVDFTLDTTPPAVTAGLLADTGASATDNLTSNPSFKGQGEPNAVVRFKVDGKAITETAVADAAGNWTYTPKGLSDGRHTLVAIETDAAGNSALASYTFTLDTTPPTITAALQSDTGMSAQDGLTASKSLSGTTDPNTTVRFVIDGQAIDATATADASGRWVFEPAALADGPHTIVASVTDPAGNVGSATVAFTLDTTAPAVTVGLQADTGASASDRLTSNAALRGKGDANATVQFTVDGQASVRTAVADASGNWVYTPRGLSDGEHTIVATETDAAGNTGSSTLTFTFDTVAPVISAALKADTGLSAKDGVTSDATLSGSTDAGSTVSVRIDGATTAETVKADASGNWVYTPRA
ncbi:hypothetical protein ASF60_14990 [Methylobacterium sp. Leaf113]|nr:hypothetical protein ASF60_14990 [Methylobacterium sp. Leaf113]